MYYYDYYAYYYYYCIFVFMDGDNMLTVTFLLFQECCYSAFLSKTLLLWQSHLKKTGLFLFSICVIQLLFHLRNK